MSGTSANGASGHYDRVYLEKMRVAADVLLRHCEDPGRMITDVLETELHLLRDRVELALMLPESAADILPWLDDSGPR